MTTKNHAKTLCIIIGTRPNFIKVTQFRKVAQKHFPNIEVQIVHTGQHYDEKMAHVFFDQFGLRPDVFLNTTPAHPGLQIAEIIASLTDFFTNSPPDLVMVVGDVNSTLAAALAANKCGLPIAHLESGLRSRDLDMPEEHNRRVADLLSAIHFITEDSGLANLRAEGYPEHGFSFVGNTMIDTLVAYQAEIQQSQVLLQNNLEQESYMLCTLHRPSNVDNIEGLNLVLRIFKTLAVQWKIVFTAHPRTLARIEAFGLKSDFGAIQNLVFLEPQGYFDFQKLVAGSVFVLTDSGGIQEETTYLRKPCLTLRPNTERPVTIELGSNTLLEFDLDAICRKADDIANGDYKKGEIPALWDGMATHRVLSRIGEYFENGR